MAPLDLTQEELKRWVSYDPETGMFSRLIFKGNCRPGDKIGGINHDGYVVIRVAGNKHMAHRLAWLYMYGKWPDKEIDHANRNRADNRILNLREATRSENNQNSSPGTGSSGYMGAYPHGKKWKAKICVLGHQIYLGSFDDPETAHQAYMEAKKKYHPMFTIGPK